MAHKKIKCFFVLIVIYIFSFVMVNVYAEYTTVSDANFREIQFPIGENYYLDNGEKISTDMPAILTDEGVTLIPLRQVCKLYNMEEFLSWDEIANSATVTLKSGTTLLRAATFIANKSGVVINGITIETNGFPVIISINGKGVLYVPIRAFGTAFGFPIYWDENTRSAIFNKGLKYVNDEVN